VRELRDLAAVESFADRAGAWIDTHEPGTLNAGPNPDFVVAQIKRLTTNNVGILGNKVREAAK
jgi:hypothetical protein